MIKLIVQFLFIATLAIRYTVQSHLEDTGRRRLVETQTVKGDGSMDGIAHIKRWNGERYLFQGEGDLVLLHAPDFGDGGLAIHVRTTIRNWYTFMERIAVRIGGSTLEMAYGNTGKFTLDGEEYCDLDLPITLAGYTFDRAQNVNGGMSTTYILRLDADDFISLRTDKSLVALDISINERPELATSSGLMGQYKTGAMLARDGKTVLPVKKHAIPFVGHSVDTSDAMGFEWQVRNTDPELFKMLRDPQWPTPCNLVADTISVARRSLRASDIDLKNAQRLCAGRSQDDFSFCVLDVMALGDPNAVSFW